MVKILFLPQILKNVESIHLALKDDLTKPTPDESNPSTKLIEATRFFHPQCAIQETDIVNIADPELQIGNGVTTGTIRFRTKDGFVRKGATWIVFPDDVNLGNLNSILDFCRAIDESKIKP